MRKLLWLFAFLLMVPGIRAVEIIGHRGASYDAPENTLASFKLGYGQNADGCELDIHLTADGQVVVMHDYDTKRVGGVTNKIATQTYKNLQQFEIGRWGKWTNATFHERVPLLKEVLPIIPAGKKLFIEIKTGPEIIPALKEVLDHATQKPEQLVIITFNYDSAKAAKETFPKLKTYWLVDYKKDKAGKFPEFEEMISKAKAIRVDGVDVNFNWPLTKENVARIKAAGLECHVWTVDDPAKAKELAANGVDSITTNRPAFIREQLAK
jgi:glycerophosphoryl diester phosphodiesterase